jgi:hypothetical protein
MRRSMFYSAAAFLSLLAWTILSSGCDEGGTSGGGTISVPISFSIMLPVGWSCIRLDFRGHPPSLFELRRTSSASATPDKSPDRQQGHFEDNFGYQRR